MPEIPEVQAHSERMAAALGGSTLKRFEPLNFAVLKTFNPPPDGAVGHELVSVGRRAKYLIMEFANGHRHVLHLMQGGRLRPDEKRTKKPRFGVARWVFTSPDGDDRAWLFTEAGSERKAGVWVIDGDPLDQEPLSGLGPEAVALNRQDLEAVLGQHSRRIHGLLRQQKVIAGLGRMLANEICYQAKLSPFANASKLNADEIDRLHGAINSVVEAATDHERTLDDIGKSADRPSKVHNRAGEACLGCDDTVRTVEYRRYTVFYCPTEQTGGKILADNTTSKFLK
jgi:formamidopyrimidine-DNA glycosylase